MAIVFEDRSETVTRGRLVTFEIAMDPIPDRRMRTIRVWTPESYDGTRRFPVLYMHDGQHMFTGRDAPAFMGSWQCEERICQLEPEAQCMIVAIDTSDDRGSELLPPYKRNPNHQIPRRPDQPEYVIGNRRTSVSICTSAACASVIPTDAISGFVYTTEGMALYAIRCSGIVLSIRPTATSA